jgi:hypothetical protein
MEPTLNPVVQEQCQALLGEHDPRRPEARMDELMEELDEREFIAPLL